jgi:hypothetical protein
MFLINGLNSYDLASARFQLELAAREDDAKLVDLAAVRVVREQKRLRKARRTVPKIHTVE